MLKDTPKEPAAKKAARRWRNHDVSTRFKAEKAAANAAPPEPKETLLIENDERLKGPVNNFERRFKREIRAMMEGYSARNLQLAAIALEQQQRRLLLEKLRRLEAAQEATK